MYGDALTVYCRVYCRVLCIKVYTILDRTTYTLDVAQDYVDPDLRKLHVLSQILDLRPAEAPPPVRSGAAVASALETDTPERTG